MTDTMTDTLKVGDRVTCTHGDYSPVVGTIREVRPDINTSYKVRFDDGVRPDFAWDDTVSSDTGRHYAYWMRRDEVVVLPYSPTGEVEELRAALAAAKSAHHADIVALGESLKEAATRRQYCEEFEEEMDEFAPNLSRDVRELFLETAKRQTEQSYCVSGTATFHAHVTARSEEEAQEIFDRDPSDYIEEYTSYDVDDVESN